MEELRIRGLTKEYGEKKILQAVCLTLPPGSRTCLMGPSGSGKTTLFRILMGLETAEGGEISYFSDGECKGRKIFADTAGRFKETKGFPKGGQNGPGGKGKKGSLFESYGGLSFRVGAVFQEDRLLEELDAVQNVSLTAVKGTKTETIEQELLNILPREALHRPVRQQSGGMKRRIALARAVFAPSDLLLLDEPFTGLDLETKRRTMDWLLANQKGRTLFFSSHQEEDALLLNARVILLG